MLIDAPLPRGRALIGRFAQARSGLAMIEFALTLPIVLTVGCYGIELSSLALAHLRISHAAIDLADNAARVGTQNTSTGIQTLTETDLNDAIRGLLIEGTGSGIGKYARVTISSLEAKADSNGNNTQFLHWQRCVGVQTGSGFDSTYSAPVNDSGKTVSGIGSPQLTAPSGSGLIYVEINYQYQPVFGTAFVSAQKIRYTSAMIVRATRSPTDAITNPASAPRMTCDKHTDGSELS